MPCKHRELLNKLVGVLTIGDPVGRTTKDQRVRRVLEEVIASAALSEDCANEHDIEEAMAFAQIQIDDEPIVYEPAAHLSADDAMWITVWAHAKAQRFAMDRDTLAAQALHNPKEFYMRYMQYMDRSVRAEMRRMFVADAAISD